MLLRYSTYLYTENTSNAKIKLSATSKECTTLACKLIRLMGILPYNPCNIVCRYILILNGDIMLRLVNGF